MAGTVELASELIRIASRFSRGGASTIWAAESSPVPSNAGISVAAGGNASWTEYRLFLSNRLSVILWAKFLLDAVLCSEWVDEKRHRINAH
jgi:hypothetical protein